MGVTVATGDPGHCLPCLPPAARLQADSWETGLDVGDALQSSILGCSRLFWGLKGFQVRCEEGWGVWITPPPAPRGGWVGAGSHGCTPLRAKTPHANPTLGPPPRPPSGTPQPTRDMVGLRPLGTGGGSTSHPFGDSGVHRDGVPGALLDDQVHVVVLQDRNHLHLHGPPRAPATGHGWGGGRPHAAKRGGTSRPHTAKQGDGPVPRQPRGEDTGGVPSLPPPTSQSLRVAPSATLGGAHA